MPPPRTLPGGAPLVRNKKYSPKPIYLGTSLVGGVQKFYFSNVMITSYSSFRNFFEALFSSFKIPLMFGPLKDDSNLTIFQKIKTFKTLSDKIAPKMLLPFYRGKNSSKVTSDI